MPYRVSKTFRFSAAHALTQLSSTHKCHNLHGHNYEVTVTLESSGLRLGMVVDFGDISEWWREHLEPLLDHRNLNKVPELTGEYFYLTAECLARFIFHKAVLEYGRWVYSVKVQETPTCWAEYVGDPEEEHE